MMENNRHYIEASLKLMIIFATRGCNNILLEEQNFTQYESSE